MPGLVETATAILSGSEARLARVSANIANVTTPAYKRQVSFASLVGKDPVDPNSQLATQSRSDMARGKLAATGNPLDLAIDSDGFFQLRDGSEMVYSRAGQFRLGSDGSVITPQGHVLQQAGGGDLILDSAAVEILTDGTVLDAGRPVARIAVYKPDQPENIEASGGSIFRMADGAPEVAEPGLRQGEIEASNVSVGDEMVTMMAAVRQAETGARLVQTYDDLLGRAITTFGQGGR